MAGKSVSHSEESWAQQPAHVLRCTANYKSTGTQCKREAFPGTNVCGTHGALVPGVQAAAARRIQMSVDDAAKTLLTMVQDPAVEVREKVKILHDLLDRGGLGATSKVLVGVVTQDPIERLFASILADPDALVDPYAEPIPHDAETIRLNRQALEDDEGWELLGIVEAELVEEIETAARLPSPELPRRNPTTPPRHIREGFDRAQALRDLL